MTQSLVVECGPGELWAALCEDGDPVELRILRSGTGPRIGDVLLGRIVALKPELPAALVDLGLDRPAFLSVEDTPRKSLAGLVEGEAVTVQVTKAAREGKAVNVTMRLRLAEARRQAIEAARAQAAPPARLEPEEPPIRALIASLAPVPDRIVLDDRAAFAEARRLLMPQGAAAALSLHAGREALFETEGIAEAIEQAQSPRVVLPKGASLGIERTEAAILLDVDSGGAPLMATNLAAAKVVARQLRLRNLAGPIVVDFIAMQDRAQRTRVAEALTRAAAGDPAEPRVLGWTRLGHLEIVRKRSDAALDEILYERNERGGPVRSALTVALAALRAAARSRDPRRLRVAPEVASALAEGAAKAARLDLEVRLGRPLAIAAEPGRPREAFDIEGA
jgi:ribonuclease G